MMTHISKIARDIRRRQKQQRFFVRAKVKGGKFKYVGYVSRVNGYSNVLITSWLLRFGGYEEVRYYNSKTKRMLYSWTLETHDENCRKHCWNDFVLKDQNPLSRYPDKLPRKAKILAQSSTYGMIAVDHGKSGDYTGYSWIGPDGKEYASEEEYNESISH